MDKKKYWRKGFRLVPVLVLAGGLCASCELETSDNGALDGFWLLSATDTLATAGHADLSDCSLTWAFQGRLLELRSLDGSQPDVVCSFRRTADSLCLSAPHLVDRPQDDPPATDVAVLHSYGIGAADESFLVEHLGRKNMVLRSATLRLSFRKY